MDNASYHLTPAPGSVNVSSFTTKGGVIEILDRYDIPYRAGRAPMGDSLEQLKRILTAWLDVNAETHNIMVGVTRMEALLKAHGHFPPLLTPPYHPELQPIERFWRDVKMCVAREYAGRRSVIELRLQVKAGFIKYGTAKSRRGSFEKARAEEAKYKQLDYIPVVEVANDLNDDSDIEDQGLEDDSESDDDDDM